MRPCPSSEPHGEAAFPKDSPCQRPMTLQCESQSYSNHLLKIPGFPKKSLPPLCPGTPCTYCLHQSRSCWHPPPPPPGAAAAAVQQAPGGWQGAVGRWGADGLASPLWRGARCSPLLAPPWWQDGLAPGVPVVGSLWEGPCYPLACSAPQSLSGSRILPCLSGNRPAAPGPGLPAAGGAGDRCTITGAFTWVMLSIPLPPQRWPKEEGPTPWQGIGQLPPGTEHPGCIPITSYLGVLLDQEQEWGQQQLAEVAVGLAGSWSASHLQGEGRINNGVSGPRGFACVAEGVTAGIGQGRAARVSREERGLADGRRCWDNGSAPHNFGASAVGSRCSLDWSREHFTSGDPVLYRSIWRRGTCRKGGTRRMDVVAARHCSELEGGSLRCPSQPHPPACPTGSNAPGPPLHSVPPGVHAHPEAVMGHRYTLARVIYPKMN